MTEQQPRDIHDMLAAGEVAPPALQLDQNAKEQWGREDHPLEVLSVQYGNDEANGPYFQIQARSGEQPVTFRLWANGVRDSFLSSLAEVTAQGPVSGLRLRTYDGGKGKPRVELEPS